MRGAGEVMAAKPQIAPQYTHLYYEWNKCWDGCWAVGTHDCYEVRACPVTRVTAKRIYFRGAENGPKYLRDKEWFIDRAAIERGGDIIGQTLSNGGVYHRRIGAVLHLEPPERESAIVQRLVATPNDGKSVAELRKEAADLHPDRGGDAAQFRKAYARYATAKARAGQSQRLAQ
jgi:hypothetical protein